MVSSRLTARRWSYWEGIDDGASDRDRPATAVDRGDIRAEHLGALKDLGELAIHEGPGRMPADRFESYLPDMALLIGQSDMPKSRLDRAPKLRAIINVETNFLQNVDYDACFERGIHVLAPGSAFAKPVAEMALGMAIDLCRGVTAADRAMRQGQEKWLLDGAEGCFSLYGARIGLIGFGDLARAFTPARRAVRLSDQSLRPVGVRPFHGRLRRRLRVARGGVENEPGHHRVRLRDQREPGLLRKTRVRDDRARLCFLLMSRAGVVDFPEFLRAVESGRFRAATDVFPQEPAPLDEPARKVEGLLLSPHRAGAMTDALYEIGRQTVADAGLILRGLPPLSCRRAQRETVALSRSKPIERS